MQYNQEEVNEIFEIVFNLSAKEIYEKIEKVRNRKEIAKKRWFWELLQNAKDAVKPHEKVSVRLTIGQDLEGIFVLFEHNGNPFKYKDARNLVFPYSEKSDEENSDKSGKFGTGFLATHVLSDVIRVKGILTKENTFYDFEFKLNRSGKNKPEISASINKSWDEFKQKQIPRDNFIYTQSNYDTSFKYYLSPQTKEIAIESLQELNDTIPYALTFIPKIKEVSILNKFSNENLKFSRYAEPAIIDNGIKETIITISKNGIPNQKYIVSSFDDSLDVAIEVKKQEGQIFVNSFQENQPNLFCPFPLIGNENLDFPVIINSESFIPKEERDGIWLSSEGYGLKNQPVFEKVVIQFYKLILYASKSNWKKTYLLVQNLKKDIIISDFDRNWFKEKIQNLCKNLALITPLVDTANGKRLPIKKENEVIFFPSAQKEEIREKIWEYLKDLRPEKVTLKTDIHNWYSVLWDDFSKVNLEEITKAVSKRGNLDKLSEDIKKPKEETITWLDSFVGFVNKEFPTYLNLEETKILPNQSSNGKFCRHGELFLDDETINEELKVILAYLSILTNKTTDWRDELLHKSIYPANLNFPYNRTRGISIIGPLITEIVKEMLKNDSPSNEFRTLFSALLNWLNDNPQKAKDHFKGLKTDTLLYRSADSNKIKYVTEMMQLDREGKIPLERQKQILGDPDLDFKIKLGEEVLAERQKKQIEFQRNLSSGKVFEDLFQQIMNPFPYLNIQKVDGEQDYIITNTLKQINNIFYIEMKSINSSETKIELTPPQAKKASKYRDNYFLCIVPHNGHVIDEGQFRNNARFDGSIGLKLLDKINLIEEFEKVSNGINVYFEDAILGQYNKYRYKFEVQKTIWGNENFNGFIERIKN